MLAMNSAFYRVSRLLFFSEGHHSPLILYLYCYHEAVFVNDENDSFASIISKNCYFCLSDVGINDIGGWTSRNIFRSFIASLII